MAVGVLCCVAALWWRNAWSLTARACYTLVTVATVAFLGWVAYRGLVLLPT